MKERSFGMAALCQVMIDGEFAHDDLTSVRNLNDIDQAIVLLARFQ